MIKTISTLTGSIFGDCGFLLSLTKILYVIILFSIAKLLLSIPKIIIYYMDLKKYKIEIDFDFSSMDGVLDTIISDSFAEYLYMSGKALEGYINEDMENTINKEVSNIVAKKISNNLLNRLMLVYNSDSVPDIISTKIYMTVSSYTVEKNKINYNIKER